MRLQFCFIKCLLWHLKCSTKLRCACTSQSYSRTSFCVCVCVCPFSLWSSRTMTFVTILKIRKNTFQHKSSFYSLPINITSNSKIKIGKEINLWFLRVVMLSFMPLYKNPWMIWSSKHAGNYVTLSLDRYRSTDLERKDSVY